MSSESQPYFSVVIPTYNRADLLPETIDTILNQTFDSYEIIIVDDGSKDDTDKVIAEKYSAQPQVKYFWKENGERGLARNFGFNKAAGDYVLFFDSDDFMMENHLELLMENIKRLNHPNFIATKHLLITDDGKVSYNLSKNLKEGWYNYKELLIGNWLACHFCVKKSNPSLSLFQEDRSYAILEDWMFLIENLYKDKIYLIDSFTVHQRNHDGRSMNNNSLIIERRIKANEYLIDKIPFNDSDKQKISYHSYYFCAIHAYLAKEKNKAKALLKEAYKLGGLSKGVVLLYLKLLIGYYPKSY